MNGLHNILIDEIYNTLSRDDGDYIIHRDNSKKVYISYCRADEEIAIDIARQFDENYIEYFLDTDDLQIDDEVSDIINKCSTFIPIVSKNIRNANSYLWQKWNYAVNKLKPEQIFPLFKNFIENPHKLMPIHVEGGNELKYIILDKYNTRSIVVVYDNKISEKDLKMIKKEQYK